MGNFNFLRFPNQTGVSANPGQPAGPSGAGNDDDDLYS